MQSSAVATSDDRDRGQKVMLSMMVVVVVVVVMMMLLLCFIEGQILTLSLTRRSKVG